MTTQSPIEWAHTFFQAIVEGTPETRIVFRGRAGFAFSDLLRGSQLAYERALGGILGRKVPRVTMCQIRQNAEPF